MLKKKKHFSCEIANSLQLLVCCHNLSFITLSGKGIPLKWESQYNTIFESHLIVTSTLWNLCLELKGYVFRSIGSTHSYYCLSCPAFIVFFISYHVLKKKKKVGKSAIYVRVSLISPHDIPRIPFLVVHVATRDRPNTSKDGRRNHSLIRKFAGKRWLFQV
jgi:hypothetical protein